MFFKYSTPKIVALCSETTDEVMVDLFINFTLCQSKLIEVNSEGSDSNNCCIEGACLCGSLFKALLHIENDTVITITSGNSQNHVTI